MTGKAKAILLGVAGRRLQQLRDAGIGGRELARLEHPQLDALELTRGDRVYLATYRAGHLGLLGRITVAGVLPGAVTAGQPLALCDFDAEVPHRQARDLRFSDGGGLRFSRETAYELHPAALLRPRELSEQSAERLDALVPALPPAEHAEATIASEPSAVVGPPEALPKRGEGLPAPGGQSRRRSALRRTGSTLAALARERGLSRGRLREILGAGDSAAGAERAAGASESRAGSIAARADEFTNRWAAGEAIADMARDAEVRADAIAQLIHGRATATHRASRATATAAGWPGPPGSANPAERRRARNPTWTEPELILALDLYIRRGQPPASDPEVVALSELLNRLGIHKRRPNQDAFRNPNGVHMKLGNFKAPDPAYPGVGLQRGGRGVSEIWARYSNDPAALREAADRARRTIGSGTDELTARAAASEAGSTGDARVARRPGAAGDSPAPVAGPPARAPLLAPDGAASAERRATDGRDYSRFHIIVRGDELPDQNKRNSVRTMVTALAERGVDVIAIAERLGRHLKPIDGEPEDVARVFEATYPSLDPAWWYTEHPIRQGGRTWILDKSWGKATQATLEDLSRSFPEAGVTFRRSDS